MLLKVTKVKAVLLLCALQFQKGKLTVLSLYEGLPVFLQFISWGINLPKRMRRAAPSAAQWENCSSTKIWYAKGMQRAPASAGRNLKEHTGTLVLYSEIREDSCTHKYEAANCS